ncbi:hypothetical protein [Lacticaseibacillus saniviri]|nr:hypothetical protein [Lacticaseibacillus saniviri]MCG4281560.1 hypothetical protein [Lacticaseibacillus saniviri]
MGKKKLWQWVKAGVMAGTILMGFAVAQKAQAVDAATNVGTVNYVQGQGVSVYDNLSGKKTGKYLKTGSKWTVQYTGLGNYGKVFAWGFNLGGNQWVLNRYLDLRYENSTQTVNSVVKIHYVPGYGIAVWNSPKSGHHVIKHALLKHGTSWKAVSRAVVNGHVWYNLGRNQWLDGSYANITRETSRSDKSYDGRIPANIASLTGGYDNVWTPGKK